MFVSAERMPPTSTLFPYTTLFRSVVREFRRGARQSRHRRDSNRAAPWRLAGAPTVRCAIGAPARRQRSEEHTSELQSHVKLVCRLLLEKKHLASTVVRYSA